MPCGSDPACSIRCGGVRQSCGASLRSRGSTREPLLPGEEPMFGAIIDQVAGPWSASARGRARCSAARDRGRAVAHSSASSLSHDLKTPWRRITGAITALRQSPTSTTPEARED